MKYLLILLLLFSTKSFADLKGKSLLCKKKNNELSGYFFEKNYKYHVISLYLVNDTFRISSTSLIDYSLEPDKIKTGLTYINRVTLKMIGSINGKELGQCELYNPEEIDDRIEEHRNERQRIYNKKLEGNKL